MELLVTENHERYEGQTFPIFAKGTKVSELVEGTDDEYPYWFPCVIEGYETFIPDIFVVDGVLACDYNPTEIEVEKGQTVMLIDIVFEWLYVKDENSNEGWLPANKIASKGLVLWAV